LIEGGRTRVRPILMTAFATILALIPLAAGFNQGSIIAAELGTVVIGGLFSSTLLTLLVVPVVYSLVDDAKRGTSRLLQRGRSEPGASAVSAD
jgi:multidrug efflux pump subunit AcrB